MDYIIQLPSGCRRRSMRWPRTKVINSTPPHRSHRICRSPRSLIPSASLSTWRYPLWLHRQPVQLHLAPTRCQICTCTKQETTDGISVYTSNICTDISKSQHKIKTYKYITHLYDQKPPREAIPCLDPPESLPQHRGTEE
jgi:hypothetical protein